MVTDPFDVELGRRQFNVLAAAALAAPAVMSRPEPHGHRHRRKDRVSFYASTGPELTRYAVDERELSLRRRESVTVPAAIQYAWPHPERDLLYVAYSDRAGTNPGTVNGVATLRIDGHGRLHSAGPDLALPSRPIHITVDATGSWLLAAYNDPSGVEVYRIGRGGLPRELVLQPEPLDAGVYAHQVRVTPSNRTVILPTRGNEPTETSPEDPGALKVFDLVDGRLLDESSVAPNGGYGFGPRHVDFHPRRPWMFVSDEKANALHVFRLHRGRPEELPVDTDTTLHTPGTDVPGQVAGAVHVSQDGRHVYVANRADATTGAEQVFAGGENSIAVFAVDAATGQAERVQNAPTRSFHVRTFSLHPDGRMLVAASVAPMRVRSGDGVRTVPARLTVFKVRRDGTLDLVRTDDVDTSAGTQFWCGFVEH